MLLKTYHCASRHFGTVLTTITTRNLAINAAVVGSRSAVMHKTRRPLSRQNLKIDSYERLPVPFGMVHKNTMPYSVSLKSVQVAYLSNGSAVPHKSGRSKARSIIELMRLDKPTGTILALTPSLWSVGLVTPDSMLIPDIRTIVIFTAGAIIARGMGCTLNDILDRKYDRLVERTRMRPIACGDISTKEGLFYLSVQSIIGLYVLCLNNIAVIKLGLFSGLMISTYPLFKRFTYWPQVMLALTMNWGVIMGYAAVNGTVCTNDLITLLPIYFGAIFWTMYYDTIYAHQDKTDDMFIGVKSSAIKLGSQTKSFLHLMTCSMALSLTLAGSLTGQLWPYYASIASAGMYQANQVRNVNLNDTNDCWRAFDRQKYVGCLILGGILTSVALKSVHSQRNQSKTSEIVEVSS